MDYPERIPNHIKETTSYKIFANHIPDSWIIRDVTERDYGVDCYVEMVNEKNQLIGDLACVQLKSMETIKWNLDGTYLFSKAKISTSNYWKGIPVPVFLFLTDNEKGSAYFLCVKNHIRNHYLKFAKQKSFTYRFSRGSDLFDINSGPSLFRLRYLWQGRRERFETEMKMFLSNLLNYQNFLDEHNHRDYHLPIESIELIFFESMFKNFEFLADYLLIQSNVGTLKELKAKSKETFPNEDYYELFEHDLTQIGEPLRELSKEIIKSLKALVDRENEYWMLVNLNLFNYVNNLNEDGDYRY
ncbi:DUF4365 domain-containing protein [uncultured Dokdonia sp.]|uniref:DUF4365 domain-containing protein n=1 Tax=uncultured Dokdonia sp. TaxID=575653 RepID=UPI00261D2C86|nr:DUF4365 domain-containing protein [uncultured Dokdonia sp.]